MRPATLQGAPVETFEGFDIAVGPPQVITNPDWARKPTNAELLSALPAAAVQARKNGRAAVQCRVLATGGLADCAVVSESPLGYGFGEAALALTPLFVVKPKTVDGKAVTDGRVTIPINWAGLDAGLATATAFRVYPWAPWAKAPTAAEVAAAFPAQAAARRVFGRVSLRCRLNGQGVPRDCETQLETPTGQGFAAAARRLSQMFQAQVSDLTPEQLRSEFQLTVDFSERALAASPARYIGAVDWVRSFDPNQAQAVYPEAAIKAGVVSGRATTGCRIAAEGSLEACSSIAEAPPGLGFGAAALMLAQAMRANLWTQNGEPTVGDRVDLPIRLIYSGQPKEAPKPGAAAAPDRR